MSVSGKVTFKAGEAEYTLRFSIDALCQLEEAAGKGIIALIADLNSAERMSIGLARKILWAGLQEHHPGMTIKQAGDLILAAGGLARIIEHLEVAFRSAFPQPQEGSGEARPPQPSQNGTGSAS